MSKEPAEPSMFDDIQTILFPSADQIGKVFVALGQDMRRCLICDEVFAPQVAAEHAKRVCYPK